MSSSPSPLLTALAAQVMGGLIAGAAIQIIYPPLWTFPLAAALVQGACAALAGYKLESPSWWIPIHIAFTPLLLLGARLPIAPTWYLGAFALLLMIFWRTDQSRVPLYLSTQATAESIKGLLPPHPCSVIDLGCGNGQLLKRLALMRPDCTFRGIEHAPLTWLWARINTAGRTNVRIHLGNFWHTDLSPFETAYAFLSPVPMAKLWQKAQSEMRPGSRLISNSFAIPDTPPAEIVAVADRRRTQLYIYQTTAGE
ncbi:hypothetical protein B9N43_15750 [Denitratisoma sp. DHT3]|uniref:methyltransferase domain-containing protein n=1 Tax=Denitratisoma sp. DHT3 TaxID=1981880 RepID=UPI00119852C1|nr:methyltransferase domain-containing protein [Denitratisoma sp. DHT3]QDX82560.1 hypothetical protein B9N43_15750 [Denitratisoma sp. DHT3]